MFFDLSVLKVSMFHDPVSQAEGPDFLMDYSSDLESGPLTVVEPTLPASVGSGHTLDTGTISRLTVELQLKSTGAVGREHGCEEAPAEQSCLLSEFPHTTCAPPLPKPPPHHFQFKA